MKKYPVKEFEARTIISVWGNVKTETEPLASCLEPYIQAHYSALSTGDFNVSTSDYLCNMILGLLITVILTFLCVRARSFHCSAMLCFGCSSGTT